MTPTATYRTMLASTTTRSVETLQALVQMIEGTSQNRGTSQVCVRPGKVHAGYVHLHSHVFRAVTRKRKTCYVGRNRNDPGKAIALARESGSVPTLTHPHTLGITTASGMANLLSGLWSAGLVGLEVSSGDRRHERAGYADLARRFGLAPSGGSDYHGADKPGLMLGRGDGDLAVPESVLEQLRERVDR